MDKIWDSLTLDIIRTMSREDCIALLQWNDHNGAYTDELAVDDGFEPLTADGARAALARVRFEAIECPSCGYLVARTEDGNRIATHAEAPIGGHPTGNECSASRTNIRRPGEVA